MGYDVHIIRSAQRVDDGISLNEWQGYLDLDPDLQRPPPSIPNHAGNVGLLRSSSDDPSTWPWLIWTSGSIQTKYPDRRTLLKMLDIANHFGAQVVGDEGERYALDSDGRVIVDGREWQAPTLKDTPSVSHDSRWAALWVFELHPFASRVDEERFSSLLLQHFPMTQATASELVNYLQNSCRVVLGTQSKATSIEFPASVRDLGLSCEVIALEPHSPERYPIWLAPADFFKPHPWKLEILGYEGTSGLDSTPNLLSEQLGISLKDAQEQIAKLRQDPPIGFTFRDLEEACRVAELLRSHGFIVKVNSG